MRDNAALKRFEIDVEGHVVFADYSRDGLTLAVTHVESPPELRGKGAAGALMQEIADYARNGGLKIIPICSYAAAWLERHKEYS